MSDFNQTLDAVLDLVLDLQALHIEHDVDDFLKQLRREEWHLSMGFAGLAGLGAGRRAQALIHVVEALRAALAKVHDEDDFPAVMALRLQQRAIEEAES